MREKSKVRAGERRGSVSGKKGKTGMSTERVAI